jgi:general nucleoside transport system permease protein
LKEICDFAMATLAFLQRILTPQWREAHRWLAPIGAIIGSLSISGIAIALAGFNPFQTYVGLFEGAFGSSRALGVTITNATPLILAGLGVALPLRSGLLNIGGEGQIYIGALFSTLVALALPSTPAVVHLPLTLLAGFVGGSLWGAIPSWLRATRGLNEIITTIMMNYIGFWIISFLVHGPLKDPESYGYAWTVRVPASAQLPILDPATRINLGIVVALFFAAVAHYFLWHTTLGFEIRAVGAGHRTARFVGIPVERSTIMAMLLGGGLAGVAGAAVILGVQHRLSDFFSPGYGFEAIAVALVGQSSPAGVVFAGLFYGALRSGTTSVQCSIGIPVAIAFLIQGITLLFVIGSQSPTLIGMLRKRETARHVDLSH